MEIKVYTFSELPDEVQQKVINESILVEEYFWSDDVHGSLLAWAKEIGLEMSRQYYIDWENPSRSEINYDDKYVDYDHVFDLDKYLTGYVTDYILMNTWNETKDIDACISAFLADCNGDFLYQRTTEYAEEFFDSDIFTENGKII